MNIYINPSDNPNPSEIKVKKNQQLKEILYFSLFFVSISVIVYFCLVTTKASVKSIEKPQNINANCSKVALKNKSYFRCETPKTICFMSENKFDYFCSPNLNKIRIK